MNLIFLGRGAAFNPTEGNTSAYWIDNKTLFLIDVGETVFQKIMKENILENVEDIYIMITHTHSDHIGSIGSLASFCYYQLQKKIKIIIPTKPKYEGYINNIENILEAFSCHDKYEWVKEKELDSKYDSFQSIQFQETLHSKDLNCYGILFDTEEGKLYYSGDTKESINIERLIADNQKIDKIYVDTTNETGEDIPHLSIEKLNTIIPTELRKKVYCMHINNYECIKKIKEYGMNIVEVE